MDTVAGLSMPLVLQWSGVSQIALLVLFLGVWACNAGEMTKSVACKAQALAHYTPLLFLFDDEKSTSSNTQGLLLALCSSITHGETYETI